MTRRGGTRPRLVLRVALVVWAALAFGAAQTAAATTVSTTLTTTAITDVTVRSGDAATLKFRAADPQGGTVLIDLFVADSDGRVVRHPVRAREVRVGVVQSWTGRLRLSPGRYIYFAEAVDRDGRREGSAGIALIRVRPVPLVPTAAALERATTWAAGRAGRVAFAVVDSRGRLHGWRTGRQCTSASVVKSMLLVQYLRTHATVTPRMRDLLARMIQRSDNAATAVVYDVVGRRGLVRLARLAGMTGFEPRGGWITTLMTAGDMARFFRDMHRYVPGRHRRFADHLLASIVPGQRWGIPPAAEPRGYTVFFKGGWLGSYVLANQAARLERGDLRLGVAVFTSGNPDSRYGLRTITGVTERLLTR